MPLDVTRTIASVGCSIRGSGTSSTRTSRLPCHVTAFISDAPFVAYAVGFASGGRSPGHAPVTRENARRDP
jgi:hypothetical protein